MECGSSLPLSTADSSAVKSFYICKTLYLQNSQPSPPWGRGWIASGALISRCETGEGVHNRASYPNASGSDHTTSKIFCTHDSGASLMMPFENCGTTALVRRLLACGEVRALSGLLHLSEQENAWCDKDARYSWFPQCSQLSTPSPPRQAERGAPFSPRLMTTPVARHPLPQGGEGREFTRTAMTNETTAGLEAPFVPSLRKCRNFSKRLRLCG